MPRLRALDLKQRGGAEVLIIINEDARDTVQDISHSMGIHMLDVFGSNNRDIFGNLRDWFEVSGGGYY